MKITKYSHKARDHWQGHLWLGRDQYGNAKVDLNLEVAWRYRTGPGLRIHFGDRGSETPLDIMIGLYWISFFFGVNAPKMGKFFEWLGRGHKRNLSLQVHSDALWWELWYDDDGGYDNHHKCDPWRQPKLYPWRWGRKKYRPWMCLRNGHIELNPFNEIWGRPKFSYVTWEVKEKVLKLNQFEGDQYIVQLALQECTSQREHGPSWARKFKHEGFRVDWESKEGIPVYNHDWKGDCVYASSVRIDTPNNWVTKAMVHLTRWAGEERVKNHYKPRTKEQIGKDLLNSIVNFGRPDKPAPLEGVEFDGVEFDGDTMISFGPIVEYTEKDMKDIEKMFADPVDAEIVPKLMIIDHLDIKIDNKENDSNG